MDGDRRFSLTAMENAVDFVSSAVRHLREDQDHRQLKYGVLHLFSGIEILLKERLRREHWALVFADVDEADERVLATGDFRSANLEQCISRLASICDVAISEKQSKYLRRLQEIRNKLVHFGVDEKMDEIRSVAAVVLAFVVDFLTGEPDPSIQSELDSIRSGLREITRFVEKRRSEIRGRLDEAAGRVVTCRACLQEAAVIDDGVRCLFCGDSAQGEEAASSYVTGVLGYSYFAHVKDGDEWPLRRCPECGQEAFVPVSEDSTTHLRRWQCLGCGQSYSSDHLTLCGYCGELRPTSYPGSGICDSCFRRKVTEE